MLSRRVLLAGAGASALAGCGVALRREAADPDKAAPAKGPAAGLTAQEHQWARTAWRYLENNTDYETGLVGGMDRSPLFTAWNAGDALAATIAAYELQVIDAREFDLRLSRLLGFLATMDLSDGQLPNKAYHASTQKMVAFDGQPADIGWSAVDVGRLLLWLKITGLRHARFQEYADKAVLRWRFCDVIDDCGGLHGSSRENGKLDRYDEGRLGYQQLAGAGYAAWGFDARDALAPPPTQTVNILGVPIQYDARDPRTTGAQAPVATMPYALAGIELGWQAPGGAPLLGDLAQQVYRVQEERWRRERQFTARSDYQLREEPYVVLDSVYAAGYAWNTISHEGRTYEELAMVSNRAAFGMWALWPGDYSRQLIDAVRFLYDPDRGWFEGRYEQGGAPNTTLTLGTNAAILEALLFRAKGRLYVAGSEQPGPFRLQTADPFARLGRCWPQERQGCARG